jgi:hypothetical protein
MRTAPQWSVSAPAFASVWAMSTSARRPQRALAVDRAQSGVSV